MNKAQLVEKLIEKTGDNKAEKVLNAFIETVEKAVIAGDKVQLVGFGVFEKRSRAARTIKSPHSDKPVQVPARNIPAFKPGKLFKDMVK